MRADGATLQQIADALNGENVLTGKGRRAVVAVERGSVIKAT